MTPRHMKRAGILLFGLAARPGAAQCPSVPHAPHPAGACDNVGGKSCGGLTCHRYRQPTTTRFFHDLFNRGAGHSSCSSGCDGGTPSCHAAKSRLFGGNLFAHKHGGKAGGCATCAAADGCSAGGCAAGGEPTACDAPVYSSSLPSAMGEPSLQPSTLPAAPRAMYAPRLPAAPPPGTRFPVPFTPAPPMDKPADIRPVFRVETVRVSDAPARPAARAGQKVTLEEVEDLFRQLRQTGAGRVAAPAPVPSVIVPTGVTTPAGR